MLYWLTALSDGGDAFNLFRYITFRAGGAFLTSLVFGFLFGRPLIDWLRAAELGLPARQLDAVFADRFTLHVPCVRFDLQPKS